jgi:hypothetical protein
MSTSLPAWLPAELPEDSAISGYGELARVADRFEPLSLEELGRATLMDRVDSKFVLPYAAVPRILEELTGQYRVLRVGTTRLGRYSTAYFDTPDLALYHAHQAGRLPRYKVRIRSYLDSLESYLEVKLKNNKGRTVKTRVPLASGEVTLERVRREALFRMSGSVPAMELEEVLTADFTRLTLVRVDAPERLTIDVGLTFVRGGEVRTFPRVAIVEIKQERHGQADARDALRTLYLRDGAVSKYCIGVAQLVPGAKKNRFKRVLSALERIQTGHPAAVSG